MQILLMKTPTINVGFYLVVTTDKDQTFLITLSLMDTAFENSTENCFQGILQLLYDLDPTANNPNTYLQVEFDTGNCKTFATIAGHLQKAAGVRLPTSSKLEGPS